MSELHVFVPQMQVSELAELPSVTEQAEMAENEHWLYVLWQKRPVVGVHATAPQMHPALLAVEPSVFEQSGPLAQRQVFWLVPHLVVEVVRVLK